MSSKPVEAAPTLTSYAGTGIQIVPKNTCKAIRPLQDKKTSQHQARIIFARVIFKVKFTYLHSSNPKICRMGNISHLALLLSPDAGLKYPNYGSLATCT